MNNTKWLIFTNAVKLQLSHMSRHTMCSNGLCYVHHTG